jgi:hypothetical protein
MALNVPAAPAVSPFDRIQVYSICGGLRSSKVDTLSLMFSTCHCALDI